MPVIDFVVNGTRRRLDAELEAAIAARGKSGTPRPIEVARASCYATALALKQVPGVMVAAAVSVLPGGTANYTVTVTSSGGFTGDVALSLSGLAGSFNPPVVVGGVGTAALTVVAPSTLGTTALVVTGTSGAVSHSASASGL
jgi:hypothetical protein